MSDKIKHHASHKAHAPRPGAETNAPEVEVENPLARAPATKPRRYAKGDGITTEKPKLPSESNPNAGLRRGTKPAAEENAIARPKPAIETFRVSGAGVVMAKPAIASASAASTAGTEAATGASTKPAIASTSAASTAGTNTATGASTKPAIASTSAAATAGTAAAATSASTKPAIASTSSASTAAAKPEDVYSAEELKALDGFDLQDAMLLGIHPKVITVYETVKQSEMPEGSVGFDGDGGAVVDPEIGRAFRQNDPDRDGSMMTVFQKKVTKLMVTPADAERLQRMQEIPKDLNWDSLVKNYGHEFLTLSPAVKDAVAKDPRRALAGLLGLTDPNYYTMAGRQIETGGGDSGSSTIIPDVEVVKEPDPPASHLGKDDRIVTKNPANGTWLSVGCEGGYVSTGKPGADLAYMSWDPEYGLVAPKAAYMEIHDDNPVFGIVVGAIVTFATGGLAGPIVAGALGGAASAAINGGNVLEGALMGGFTGGLGGVSGAISSTVSEAVGGGLTGQIVGEAVGHAATGAIGAAVRGGNVLEGAIDGAVSGGLSPLSPVISDAVGGGDFGNAVGTAVTGAATAALTGGNVLQGAISGAINGYVRGSSGGNEVIGSSGDADTVFDFEGTGIGDGSDTLANGTLSLGDESFDVVDGVVYDGDDPIGSVDPDGSVSLKPADGTAVDGPSDVVPTEPTEPSHETVIVGRGDTLYGIARNVLGDGNRWPEIYALNRDVIGANPNNLPAGVELELPGEGDELDPDERNTLLRNAYLPPRPSETDPIDVGGPNEQVDTATAEDEPAVDSDLSPGQVMQLAQDDTPERAATRAAINRFIDEAKGDPFQAWNLAYQARGADPENLALRNAEHYLFATSVINEQPSFGGQVLMATAVGVVTPLYSAVKAVLPAELSSRWFGGGDGKATPPSVEEVAWGLLGVRDAVNHGGPQKMPVQPPPGG